MHAAHPAAGVAIKSQAPKVPTRALMAAVFIIPPFTSVWIVEPRTRKRWCVELGVVVPLVRIYARKVRLPNDLIAATCVSPFVGRIGSS
jgi:hypothetical protein